MCIRDRDTITPVPDNGILRLGLEKKGNEIENVQYEVYSLDAVSYTHLQIVWQATLCWRVLYLQNVPQMK